MSAISSLSAFPNPNQGYFTLKLSSENQEDAQIIITSMLGEKIKEINTTTNKETDVQLNVPAGVYFLSVIINGESLNTKILINN